MHSQPLVRGTWLVVAAVALSGCGGTVGDAPDEGDPAPEGSFWEAGDADEPPAPGKADAVLGARAVPSSADASTTAVWEVTRQWSSKVDADFLPYFRKSDGLTWNQAFAQFVEKLETTTSVNGYKTYKLTNPWGKTLPIGALECAEQAMFLRVTFSAWFRLPFFLEAVDGKSTRVFAGHFGFRTLAGRYTNFPEFKTKYRDGSATATAANWPKDAALRVKALGADDDQSAILGQSGATFGTYLDELHANKRVGHFTMLMLVWFGSVNLADPANTFHLKPEALRAGDVLLERWQRAGIGHTLNLKRVERLANGKFSVQLASGSMPRRQSLWETAVTSRRYFTNDYMGGQGTTYEGVPLARLGGGLRRWRVATVYNGGWSNTVPGESAAGWISSNDVAQIAARPAAFEQLLDVPDPAVRRSELTGALAASRAYQKDHPASCSNREKREGLLNDLADLESDEHAWGRDEFERRYRTYDDYVFPQLQYERSRVCCFNSSTAQMAALALGYDRAQQQATGQCKVPLPFTSENFPTFKAYAAQLGRAADWKDWRADEPCPQQALAADTVSPSLAMVPYCDIRGSLP